MAANSVELAVGSATFDRWYKAFGNLLVPRVASVHPVGTFPLSSSMPAVLRFTGLRLLLQIGRACSRPEVVDDPSRLFGLLKYATSLSSGMGLLVPSGGSSRSLSLRSGIETLDSHKKAVMSDEFGLRNGIRVCQPGIGSGFLSRCRNCFAAALASHKFATEPPAGLFCRLPARFAALAGG